MKKTGLSILLIVLFLSSANAQVADNNYIIEGNIEGLGDNALVMSVWKKDNTWQKDTIRARAGKFSITGIAAQPVETAYFRTIGMKNGCDFNVFLEPGTTMVKGKISAGPVTVTGTPDNNDLTTLDAAENRPFREVNGLREQLEKAKSGGDTTAVNRIKQALDKAYNVAGEKRTEARIQFIKTHPNSLASATALYVVQDDVTWRELKAMYESLAVNVQQSSYCSSIPYKIAVGERTDIGQVAPAFKLPDVNGDLITSASLRGKYVLLDFWASWCVPCRQENKHVKQVFDRYKNKNFVILGISLDKDTAKWKEAVTVDELPWMNVCDTIARGPGSISYKYGVQPIPDNFLIDPQGKIIGRRLFGKALEQKLAEVLK